MASPAPQKSMLFHAGCALETEMVAGLVGHISIWGWNWHSFETHLLVGHKIVATPASLPFPRPVRFHPFVSPLFFFLIFEAIMPAA